MLYYTRIHRRKGVEQFHVAFALQFQPRFTIILLYVLCLTVALPLTGIIQ
jgi:hypothetical protein